MKKVKLVFFLVAGTLCLAGHARGQSADEQQNAKVAKDDVSIDASDSTAVDATPAGKDGDGEASTFDAQASNVEAVPQTTSSDSGSPAVLSGQNGRKRDGTNNVQRASMNMAGSPARGLQVDDAATVDRARKTTQQPAGKGNGAQRARAGTTTADEGAIDQQKGSENKSKRKKRRNKD